MPRIELSDLVQKMTPEQKILTSQFYTTHDNHSAANRRIVNVEPVVISLPSGGSEFLTYDATKMYLALELSCSFSAGSANTTAGLLTLYDTTNTISRYSSQIKPVWNTTTAAINYCYNDVSLKNLYFSRLVLSGYNYIHFLGYRITLV